MAVTPEVLPENTVRVLDHGFVRLDDAMATDLSVVNAARVSFARRKEEMDESDEGLIRFLMRDRHGCYDDATDVLTNDGWKAWPEVTGDELFASLSPEGRLVYQPALRLVRKEYRGHMVGFKGLSLDLFVTPDHRVLTSTWTTLAGRRSPSFSLAPAHSVLWKAHRHVATAAWSGPDVDWLTFDDIPHAAKPLLELVGFFIGDGHLARRTNQLSFNLRKDREIEFLRRAAHEAALELRGGDGRFRVPLGPELRRLFADCYDEQREKVIPRRLLELGQPLLESLFEGLMNSDGCRMARRLSERETYSTTSRRLADQVQELALKIGRSASVRPHPKGAGRFGDKPVWRVTIYTGRNSRPVLCRTRADADNQMGVERYDGTIHCVEVPYGTLYVRRNGYPIFCGNTPFEHNAFRFHIRCPIFVAREWFRHRI
ncbi:MAG: FAD-dependent thymidylate synthase, partial [Gaiellaceae bacterium]